MCAADVQIPLKVANMDFPQVTNIPKHKILSGLKRNGEGESRNLTRPDTHVVDMSFTINHDNILSPMSKFVPGWQSRTEPSVLLWQGGSSYC